MAFLSWRPWTLLAAALAAAIVLAAAPPVVQAQANANAEARVYFEQGNRHLARAMRARGARKRRLLEQALDSYVESLRIVRSRNVVFNAALTLQELDRNDEAFAYYTEYLGMPGLTDDERAEGQRRRQALLDEVAVVAVASEPAGAQVRVDRRDLAPRGRTPLEVALPEGRHTLYLSLDGYEPASLTAQARTGQRVEVQASLEPTPVPVVIRAPAGGGRLTINGEQVQPGQQIEVVPGRYTIRYEPAVERVIEVEPGSDPMVVDLDVPEQPGGRGMVSVVSDVPGRVSVDGGIVGEGRQVDARVAAGRHMVEVQADGHTTARSEIDVQPGETLRLSVHMEPSTEGESTLGQWPLFAWVATGVVGITAGAFSVNALALNSDFEDNLGSRTHQENEDAADEVDQANTVADVFWIGTAAIGLTAVLLTIIDEPVEQPQSTIQVGAAPLPGGGLVMAEMPWGTP